MLFGAEQQPSAPRDESQPAPKQETSGQPEAQPFQRHGIDSSISVQQVDPGSGAWIENG